MVVYKKNRPLFLRGNSASSISVSSSHDRNRTNIIKSTKPGSVEVVPEPVSPGVTNVVKKQRRRVRFGLSDDATQIIPTLLADEESYSEDEIKRCFYSADDLAKFDKDRALTALSYIRKRERGIAWDDNDKNTIRGIESLLQVQKNGNKIRIRGNNNTTNASNGTRRNNGKSTLNSHMSQRRKKHVKAVLFNQMKLKIQGREGDELALAEISCKSSNDSIQEAIAVAKDDAIIAACISDPSINDGVLKKVRTWAVQQLRRGDSARSLSSNSSSNHSRYNGGSDHSRSNHSRCNGGSDHSR